MTEEKNVLVLPVVKYKFLMNSKPAEGEAPKICSLRLAIDEKHGNIFLRSLRIKDYNGRRFIDGSLYTCVTGAVKVDNEDGLPLDDNVQKVVWG